MIFYLQRAIDNGVPFHLAGGTQNITLNTQFEPIIFGLSINYSPLVATVEPCAEYMPTAYTATMLSNENLFHGGAALFYDEQATVTEQFVMRVKTAGCEPHVLEQYKNELNALLSNAQFERTPRPGGELYAYYQRTGSRNVLRSQILRGTADWDPRTNRVSPEWGILNVVWERAFFWETATEYPVYGRGMTTPWGPAVGVAPDMWIVNAGLVNAPFYRDFFDVGMRDQSIVPEIPTPFNVAVRNVAPLPPFVPAQIDGFFATSGRFDPVLNHEFYAYNAIFTTGVLGFSPDAYTSTGGPGSGIMSTHTVPPSTIATPVALMSWFVPPVTFGNQAFGRVFKPWLHLGSASPATTNGDTKFRLSVIDNTVVVYRTDWVALNGDHGVSMPEFRMPPHLIDVQDVNTLQIGVEAYSALGDTVVIDCLRMLGVDGGWLRVAYNNPFGVAPNQVLTVNQSRRQAYLDVAIGQRRGVYVVHGSGIRLWHHYQRIYFVLHTAPNATGDRFDRIANALISLTWRPRFLSP